jgi:hypothetical protein
MHGIEALWGIYMPSARGRALEYSLHVMVGIVKSRVPESASSWDQSSVWSPSLV